MASWEFLMESENLKTLVVVPAYNESANIEAVVGRLIDAGYDYIVVNDGSSDTTADICRARGFNFLDLKENLGIGGAIQAGHKYALANGYDVDIQFDGDGQHDVNCIPDLLKLIEGGADLAIGSRFLEPGEGFKSTFMRRVGIKWMSAVIYLVSGLRVTDPTSGFRATGRKALKAFSDDYPADYPEPEAIVVAKKKGMTIAETQVTMHERQGGRSSIGAISSIYYMIKVTFAVVLAGFGREKRV